MDGTIALCTELGVDPEDVALLALAYELKSPSPGEWARKGWVDGLKVLGCVSVSFAFYLLHCLGLRARCHALAG